MKFALTDIMVDRASGRTVERGERSGHRIARPWRQLAFLGYTAGLIVL
jgi:hypothetical protein